MGLLNRTAKIVRNVPRVFRNALRPGEFKTEGGVVLPPGVTRAMMDRFTNPIVAPEDLIPERARMERPDAPRVLHLVRRERATQKGEGPACEDCAAFRYEEGQRMLRVQGVPWLDDDRMGSRSPGKPADYGRCMESGNECYAHRFAACDRFKRIDDVVTSLDRRKGRRFDPIQWSEPVRTPK